MYDYFLNYIMIKVLNYRLFQKLNAGITNGGKMFEFHLTLQIGKLKSQNLHYHIYTCNDYINIL